MNPIWAVPAETVVWRTARFLLFLFVLYLSDWNPMVAVAWLGGSFLAGDPARTSPPNLPPTPLHFEPRSAQKAYILCRRRSM